ncbi:MAG TPA: aldo/keto reductase [Gaiella sp.]|nr:aldo/keto reductase [Gaiella sp.]
MLHGEADDQRRDQKKEIEAQAFHFAGKRTNGFSRVHAAREVATRPQSRSLQVLDPPGWLDLSALRIGLGCMRLSTDPDRDEARALETIAAAAQAGITMFDTARAYEGNEQLLARGLRRAGVEASARVVTKGGMSRVAGAWTPDGRAKAIRADCEASLASLDGLPIDLYLIHAPDPRTPWRTSVRALARLVEEGLVRRVGLANVNRRQLDEALELAPVAAVQVGLSLLDDRALRGGLVERCDEARIALIAHSPLGGPRRVGSLARRDELVALAGSHDATPAELALAWLLGLSPVVVAIPGARRPETARSAARAASLSLDDDDRASIARSFRSRSRAPRPVTRAGAEVVLVVGIPGAGKSRLAEEYVARGFVRLNRDERGGSLRELADALEDALASGACRVVLDNTYLTRAARSHAIEAACRHGATTRCVWLDTPLAAAQVNLVERMLGQLGSLPTPDELKELARSAPGVMTPTSQMRALRELEPPSVDEGFAAVEHRTFARAPRPDGAVGVFVAASALAGPGWRGAVEQVDRTAAHLVFDWRPEGSPEDLAEPSALLSTVVAGSIEAAVCPHGGGAPICWCRPPLPGLPLAFADAHGVDLSRSVLLGTSAAHRALATALGARFADVRPHEEP